MIFISLFCQNQPESDIWISGLFPQVKPGCRANQACVVFITPSANDPFDSLPRTSWVVVCSFDPVIGTPEPVAAPLQYIATHIVDPQFVWLLPPYRMCPGPLEFDFIQATSFGSLLPAYF